MPGNNLRHGAETTLETTMEFIYSSKEKIVGVFILSILILLLTVVVLLGRGKNWFAAYNVYYTILDESYNLKPGAAVKYLETDIGKVKDINIIENRVRLKLSILEKYASRIRNDTVATIESPTLIGSEYLSITPGDPTAPVLPPESSIPSQPRRSLSDIMQEFEVEKTAKMLIQAVQNLADFTQTLKDPGGPLLSAVENVNQATADIQAVTRRIQAGEGTIGALLKSTALLDAVMARLNRLDVILADLSRASARTPETMTRLNENLAVVKDLGDNVSTVLSSVKVLLKRAHDSMGSVQGILENTEKASADIPRITDAALKGIAEAREEIENIDKVVQSLQQNFLIRPNLPPAPVAGSTDAGLR